MDRRTALKGFAGITISAFLLQSCQTEPQVETKNIILQVGDWTTIFHFCNMIIPIESDAMARDRTTYLIKSVDNQFSPTEQKTFIHGLKQIRDYMLIEYKAKPQELKEVPLIQFWERYMAASANNDIQFCLQKMKDITIIHYTTRKAYMNEKLAYQFMPSNYIGCKVTTNG